MNRLIKELYKEAYNVRLSVDDFALELSEKKFAELIIMECVNVMNKNDFDGSSIGDILKEHFGLVLGRDKGRARAFKRNG